MEKKDQATLAAIHRSELVTVLEIACSFLNNQFGLER